MIRCVDQMGNNLQLEGFPKRIISIVPSQTELLSDLGLDEEIIGITKYCVHPKSLLETKNKVGGTKKLNLEKIKELQPDLIIGNKEENEKGQVLELMKHCPVWMSDIKTLEDALKMIDEIGKITDRANKALEIQNNIREQFSHFKLQKLSAISRKSSALYLIWKKPYICAGTDTFINQMLSICGFKNAVLKTRYPEVSPDEIQKLNPDFIFLSSEPYPFRQKHIEEFKTLCPSAKTVLADGEMFSWHGSRLLYAPLYFERLLSNL